MKQREIFKAIFETEEIFKRELSKELDLEQVKGPIFVNPETGLNDDLSGTEKPVSFKYKGITFEVVQSLAKWKRWALGECHFGIGEGLFVEMNAIRPHENELSKYHALHVDQYDWEKCISREDRSIEYLESQVKRIYKALKATKTKMMQKYPSLKHDIPEEIFFIDSEELFNLYPTSTPEEREKEITKKHKAVFIKKIGHKLSDGQEHGLRAPDYDDWELNGDLLMWDHVNGDVIELSSMGIRVDESSLDKQLSIAKADHKRELPFQQAILDKKLPLSIGGGIGRSRVNMFILERKDITEVK